MSTPQSDDKLLINRGGINYQINFDDMSTLNNDDLLLVNRGGTNYKMAASDLGLTIESPVVTGTLSDLNLESTRFTSESFQIDVSTQSLARSTTKSIKPFVTVQAAGQEWSSYLSCTNGGFSGSPSLAFNGSITNPPVYSANRSLGDVNGTIMSFKPTGGLSYSSSVRVATYTSGQMILKLNGSTIVDYASGNAYQERGWITLATGSGTINETDGIAFHGNDYLAWLAVEIDGTILVDNATSASTLYAVLDGSLNITDLQSADPGYTAITGTSATVTFPATLPSGEAPDVALPAGTVMGCGIQATNTEGTDTGSTNEVTPTS